MLGGRTSCARWGGALPGRMVVIAVGPGSLVTLRSLDGDGFSGRVRVEQVFGLRGPFDDGLLADLLDDVSSVRVVPRHRGADGRWSVALLPDAVDGGGASLEGRPSAARGRAL